MPSSTITQIRVAIAAVLDTAFSADWNVTANYAPSPNPSQIDMIPGILRYDTAMARGDDAITMIVRAVVQPGDLREASQDTLDALVGPLGSTTLKHVLEADRSLGGVVSSLRVTEASEYKRYQAADSDLIGVEFTVEITP